MQQTMPGPKTDLDVGEHSSDDIPSGLEDDSDESITDNGPDNVLEATEADDGEDATEDDAIGLTDTTHEDADSHFEDNSDEDETPDFAEDDDDLVDLEADEPEDFSVFEPEDSENVSGKRKPSKEDMQKGGRKRRKLGQLPTFASYEDYAKLIEDGPEDDI
jgi:ribosome biogenesis protein MAK21